MFLLNFRAIREAEILPVKFVENLLMFEEILSDSLDINLKVSRTAIPSMQVRYAHYHVTFEQNWLTFKDTTTLRPRQCKMSYHLLGPTKEPFTEQTLERGLTQL